MKRSLLIVVIISLSASFQLQPFWIVDNDDVTKRKIASIVVDGAPVVRTVFVSSTGKRHRNLSCFQQLQKLQRKERFNQYYNKKTVIPCGNRIINDNFRRQSNCIHVNNLGTITLKLVSQGNENDGSNEDNKNNNQNNKFGFNQRIDSIKCLLVGAVVGGLAVAPIAAIHCIFFPLSSAGGISTVTTATNSLLAQLEFDCDTGSIQGGLFAIVYRYCIRQDVNEQLNQGVIGSFVITRTLSRIVVPLYCTPFPLRCGPPFEYLDWNVLMQLCINGLESVALFGATAFVMDIAMKKGYISKFPA